MYDNVLAYMARAGISFDPATSEREMSPSSPYERYEGHQHLSPIIFSDGCDQMLPHVGLFSPPSRRHKV
jgi:hypothetical protein